MFGRKRPIPWLIDEKRAIREAIFDLNLPYLGFCLGHQLLADVLGGDVGPAEQPEIGAVDIHFNQTAATHPLLQGLPQNIPLVQWHLAEVKQMPSTIDIVATSKTCPIHGIALNDRVLGLQSHIEVSMDTVKEWLSSPDAQSQLKHHLGQDGVSLFEQEARAQMEASNRAAERLYSNFIQQLGQR